VGSKYTKNDLAGIEETHIEGTLRSARKRGVKGRKKERKGEERK